MNGPSELQQRNAAFRAFLDTLHPAQRRAVDQIEGPVLVIAGPGTGKTHILTARIGKILLDTDTRPQNILCLTFTDAAVLAMRRRLLERIGIAHHHSRRGIAAMKGDTGLFRLRQEQNPHRLRHRCQVDR